MQWIDIKFFVTNADQKTSRRKTFCTGGVRLPFYTIYASMAYANAAAVHRSIYGIFFKSPSTTIAHRAHFPERKKGSGVLHLIFSLQWVVINPDHVK